MRTIESLNEGWYFTKETVDPAAPPLAAMARVTLPHTWNALDGQDGGNDYYRGRCTYARSLPAMARGGRVYLECEGVSQTAEVYLNGRLLCTHEGGFSAFRVDLTDALADGGGNLLVITADNGENERTYPQFADFTFFGGIYRGVRLIHVPEKHLALDDHGGPGVAVTAEPEGEGALVRVTAGARHADGCTFRFTVLDADGLQAARMDAPAGEAALRLARARRWDGVRDPYLYRLRAELLHGGETLDAVEARFGVRSFAVDPARGFLLNDRVYPLRGVSRHQCRENMGWAITEREHREDAAIIREMGATSVRLAHYQHAQAFYDLCDEYGLVVWAEIPFISRYMDNPAARANTRLQMTELICQCRHHPSICFWGISNEITMGGEDDPHLLEDLRALHALCRTLDPTRLTTIANLSMVDMDSPHNFITDVLAYNHYFGWYIGSVEDNGPWLDRFHEKHPDRPLGISEYGAEGNLLLHSANPQVRDYSEEYQCLYHEGMLETFEQRPYLWATYVWNMFEFASDMREEGGVAGRNNKGLVNFSRTVKKDAFYAYKAYWTDAPFVHICGRRYAERDGETTSIKVYGAAIDEAVLYVDGEEVARRRGSRIFRFDGVRLRERETAVRVAGLVDGMPAAEETIVLRRVDAPNPSYALPEAPAGDGGENVINWFSGDYGKPSPAVNGFTLDDTLSDVLATEAGAAFVGQMIERAAGGGLKLGKGMLKMIGRMTFRDIARMAGKRLPEGALAYIEAELSRIERP